MRRQTHALFAAHQLSTQREDILGLITVRDEVMPLIDLHHRFGLKEAQLKLDTPVVAIRNTNGSAALLVDDADRVEVISETQVTPYCDSQPFPYIRGVAKLSSGLLLLLDTNLIGDMTQNLPDEMMPD